MAIDNTVTITGNATREPELRFTPSGQAVANFGVAVNRRWQNRQTQEWEEAVSFFDVTCWASLAENVAESVAKGTRITVAGRLDQRSWETQEGDKRSKVEIVADDVAVSLRWPPLMWCATNVPTEEAAAVAADPPVVGVATALAATPDLRPTTLMKNPSNAEDPRTPRNKRNG
ncbi:MAG: single-stranded DNA-binding protein [Acidimicrobiia bacterium]|nr:single-stranded DNA-binding protein [Acidimicrobiia bacterium]